eukprot:TRINITY_DN253_c0_g1_i1.p1 TRINITY_DN253_c0_g1~~TRINITY_DN253_c0_g1_i1.p1  ORF type:complete len:795 (-),score=196.13 TRINITY_DN253_c0_g1_i1:1275-3659(-)
MEYYRGNTPISTGAVRQAVPVGSAQSTVHMPHAVASSQESLHSSSSFGRLPSAPVVVSAVPPERTLRNSAVLRPASPSKPISPSTVTTLHSGLPSPSGAQVAASTGELGNRGLSPRNSTLEVKFKQIEDRQVALDQRLNAMAGRLQHESIERPRQLEKSQAMYMTTALSDFASTITDDMISRLTSLKEDIDKQHRASADNQLKLQEQIQRLAENQSRLMEEDTMQRLQQMENMVGEALDRSQRTEAVLAEHEQRHNVHDSRIAGCEDRCRTSGERPDAQERGSLQAHEQMLQEAHGHSRSALEGLEALRGEFQVSLAELQAQLANVQAQLQALPLQQPVLDQASHPRREDFDALHGQVRAELHEHQQRISSEVLANSQSIVDQVRAEIQAEMQNHRQGLSEQVSAGSASELSSLTQRLQVVEESLVQLASAVQSAAQNDVQTREELDRLQKQTAQMSSTSRESGDIASELTGLANRVESVERNLQRQVAETTANLSESIAISNKKLDTHAEESMVLIRQLQKQRQSMQEELSGETGPLYKLRQDLSEVQQTLSSIPELHNQLSCLQSEARGLQEVRQRLDSSVSAQAEAQAQAAQAQQEGQAKVQAEILADLQQHRQSLTEQAEALREVRERLSSAAVGASAGAAPQEAPMASSDITYGRNSFAVPAESPAVAQGRNSFAVPAESPVPVVQEVAEMPAAPAVTLRRPSCESQLVSPPSVPATPPAAVRGNGHQLVSPPSVPATPPAAVNREVAVEPVHQIRYLAPLECTGSPESISRLKHLQLVVLDRHSCPPC